MSFFILYGDPQIISLHTILGPSDHFLRLLYGAPQISFFSFNMGPPQVSLFAYYMGPPQISFCAYFLGAPLKSFFFLLDGVTVPMNTFLVCQFSAEFHYVYDQFNVELSSRNLLFVYFNIASPNIC